MLKTPITYIGDKPVKKDTVAGTRLLFPRGQAVPVDNDLLPRFLAFPSVWVLADEAEQQLQAQAKQRAAQSQARLDAQQAAQAAQYAQGFEVTVNGETLDIAKYSSRQLDTLVEAEDLLISIPKKPIADYRLAIRDALRAQSTGTV